MVRIALQAAFVASIFLSGLASPLAREPTVQKIKLTKKNASSVKAILQKDYARLSRYNSQSADSGSSGAVINEVDSYIAAVTVGSQTFDLIVDTGSSNTWVGAGTAFNDPSAQDTGGSVSVSYGSGEFSGEEYTASVSFGGLTVSDQSIGVASSSSGFDGVDGIIGFGPVDLTEDTVSNADTVPTFTDNLYSQGSISTEVLGVSFAPIPGSDTEATNGELTLGGTDSTKYSGSIGYTNLLTSGDASYYWGVAVSSITYSGTSIGSGSAIVDTGTTLIYIPSSAYSKFLKDAGGTTDSSTGLARFSKEPTGTVGFTIGGVSYTLTPSQYLIPSAQYSNFGLNSEYYYSWIGSGGSSGVDFIIGQKFLENYYAVFDTTNQRLGFATSTQDSN